MTQDGARDPTDRPDPNTLACEDCGHVWFAGERRHAYLEDGPAGPMVLCVLCLRRRSLELPGPADPEQRR